MDALHRLRYEGKLVFVLVRRPIPPQRFPALAQRFVPLFRYVTAQLTRWPISIPLRSGWVCSDEATTWAHRSVRRPLPFLIRAGGAGAI